MNKLKIPTAEQLKKLQVDLGYTQKKMAELCGYAGTRAWQAVIAGDKSISIATLTVLAVNLCDEKTKKQVQLKISDINGTSKDKQAQSGHKTEVQVTIYDRKIQEIKAIQ